MNGSGWANFRGDNIPTNHQRGDPSNDYDEDWISPRHYHDGYKLANKATPSSSTMVWDDNRKRIRRLRGYNSKPSERHRWKPWDVIWRGLETNAMKN